MARVELLLDGERQAVITGGPPWRAPVDLGDELAPRLLEAVASDARGRELGRVEQWLNLPRARAEVNLLVDPRGPVATARVSWRSVEHTRIRSLEVTFDGAPVAVDDPTSIALPEHDPGSLHVVSAEVVFPDGSSARADTAFGGPFGDRVATELTGVAVEVDGPRRLRHLDDAGAWLRVDGRLYRPLALDEGPADLYAVLDASADLDLKLLAIEMGRRLGSREMRIVESPGTGSRLDRYRLERGPTRPSPLRATGMRAGDHLFLVRPQVVDAPAGVQLFGVSEPLDDRKGGSAWQLTYLRLSHDPELPQRLADAAATAGMWASASSRPRSVVLILGPDAEDRSVLDPGQVRRYFQRLRVGLEVWYVDVGAAQRYDLDGAASATASATASTAAAAAGAATPPEEDEAARRGRRLAAARQRWGEVEDVANVEDWLRVHRALRDDLARQRILWIEGRHPPQAVTLEQAPAWVRLVGDGAPER